MRSWIVLSRNQNMGTSQPEKTPIKQTDLSPAVSASPFNPLDAAGCRKVHKISFVNDHSIPAGPALITCDEPRIACFPALAWMCPQTTNPGCRRRIASRTAILPRLWPLEETSTDPFGGE